ncbi:hypothetical protein BYT27DRAFT_7183898 [Phlegmacium glaucopus]|nr:hypothetical protein BYT27DRAFT_7183898 [Phlegmacium glaucopus]
MAGAELKELKEKLSGRFSWLRETTQKRVKNTINGYPICNNDFATAENLGASSIASYEKTLIQLTNAGTLVTSCTRTIFIIP